MSAPYPIWAEDLRYKYLRGEACMFVLHGNVYDHVLYDGKLLSLSDFLTGVMLAGKKDVIASYNPSVGVKFDKKKAMKLRV